jgi:hypothetical protein
MPEGICYAAVNAVRIAVAVSVGLRHHTSAVSRRRLGRILGAPIQAVDHLISIGIIVLFARALVDAVVYPVTIAVGHGIGDAAPADARSCLGIICRAPVKAVRGEVMVGVSVRHAATAHTGLDLIRIEDAAVKTVINSIPVSIDVRHPATAYARHNFFRIRRAGFLAVDITVAIAVNSHYAPALALVLQFGVIVALVPARRGPVAICVYVRTAASALAGFHF